MDKEYRDENDGEGYSGGFGARDRIGFEWVL
jgi:hypothetical protein